MRRRDLLLAAGGVLAAPLVRAQRQGRVPTLGLLYPQTSRTQQGTGMDLLFAPRLRELGWIVGQNLLVETASGEGREDRMPALAEQLVRKGVDVIWAAGPEAAIAAARATTTIPIAFYGVGFPVEQELVDSLQRPGRNVTGLATLAGNESQKWIELMLEVAPGRSKLSWIRVDTALQTLSGRELRLGERAVQAAAQAMGLDLRLHSVSSREDLEPAFKDVMDSGAQLLAVSTTAMTWRERQRIVDFANRHRLPSIHGARDFVVAGGLISYAANRVGMMRDSFTFVDRILRGAKPADLPVELPSRFEVVVNRGTARALGITLPQSILLRANEVIE